VYALGGSEKNEKDLTTRWPSRVSFSLNLEGNTLIQRVTQVDQLEGYSNFRENETLK